MLDIATFADLSMSSLGPIMKCPPPIYNDEDKNLGFVKTRQLVLKVTPVSKVGPPKRPILYLNNSLLYNDIAIS